MAKSKAGGTRAYIRGKIGADVYSIGKDGKGRKQQVVRSLAEQVKNPQTLAQMKGRAIMSTIMQFVAACSQFLDHAFDNVPTGQPSISEAIRLNYGLIKTDVDAHPSTGYSFGINEYKEKGWKPGAYVIAKGTAVLPALISNTAGEIIFDCTGVSTYQDLWDALGLQNDEFLTILGLDSEMSKMQYIRLTPDRSKTATTALAANNFLAAFTTEGNFTPKVTKSSNNYVFDGDDTYAFSCVGVIVSKKQGAGFVHNDAVMTSLAESDNATNYATAIATYPTGSEMFLNGGDI